MFSFSFFFNCVSSFVVFVKEIWSFFYFKFFILFSFFLFLSNFSLQRSIFEAGESCERALKKICSLSFFYHIHLLVATLPKLPSSQFFDVEAFGLVFHTPSTPYASVVGSELLWFDDNFEIYLQLLKYLSSQFSQAYLDVILFAKLLQP